MTAGDPGSRRSRSTGAAPDLCGQGLPDEPVTIGFALFPPANDIEEKLRWVFTHPS